MESAKRRHLPTWAWVLIGLAVFVILLELATQGLQAQ